MTTALDRAVTRWLTRVIAVVVAGASGYATYNFVYHLCIRYLYWQRRDAGLVTALLTLYFLFYLLSIATYLRTFLAIKFNPGVVPMRGGRPRRSRSGRGEEKRLRTQRRRSLKREQDLEAQRYTPGPPDSDPDSPGLEEFYSKDVFVCETDGRPKWCSECRNWKPDRAHHSRYLGRCVRKLDHYCPWVGGTVGETSFKYFAQFTFYCSLYCAVILAGGAYCLAKQIQESGTVDAQAVVIVAISAFFGLFTVAMTATSFQLIFINATNIDAIQKPWVYQLAVRVPNGTASTLEYAVVTYPLPKLGTGGVAQSQLDGRPESQAGEPVTARDRQAVRTFAVLKANIGENPWDLGPRGNWESIMGSNLIDWLLPIRPSPCSIHDSMVSDYEIGPLVARLRQRYGLGGPQETKDGIELPRSRG